MGLQCIGNCLKPRLRLGVLLICCSFDGKGCFILMDNHLIQCHGFVIESVLPTASMAVCKYVSVNACSCQLACFTMLIVQLMWYCRWHVCRLPYGVDYYTSSFCFKNQFLS